MPKQNVLILLGFLGLAGGALLYSMTDTWTRSWGQMTLFAGIICFAAGLSASALIDELRQRGR